MKFYGDYHTHTKFSDGKGTIEDNVKAAIKQGLKEIAITEHGYSHIIQGSNYKIGLKEKEIITELREKYSEIKILLGVESNFRDFNGRFDMTDEQVELYDIILCGYHYGAYPSYFYQYFTFHLPTFIYRHSHPPAKLLKKNTDAYIKLIEKYHDKIDVITHINYNMKLDLRTVCDACAENDILVEVSTRHKCLTEKEIRDILDSKAKLIFNTDAHIPTNVGKFDSAEAFIKKYNIDEARIANLGSSPFDINY